MRIAVLGLGFMGSTHLKALARIPQAELVAVASDDARQLSGDLSGIQGNIGGPGEKLDFSGIATYRDWRGVVNEPRIEAVDICLPTSLHAAAAVAALEACKHVLVEKPMALDTTSAEAMLDAARRSGRVLMVAQVLRFFPAYRVMTELVRSGRLGPVRAASFRRRCAAPSWSNWLLDPKISGGAAFDLLVHDLDMCIGLFGPPEAVTAMGCQHLAQGLDWITAQLHYPDFAVQVSGGWHPPSSFPFSMEYSVVCDDGAIEYHSSSTAPVLHGPSGRAVLEIDGKDGYQAEIEYFVDCCTSGRRPDLCPPGESAAAIKLASLIVESRRRRGERIPWKSA
ncbi:MAG: Gfo/Idh/MocA family protein [Bryobacteraceae bacterium]